MRWNEEEEVGRRCRIFDQVLRVGSLGVDDDRGNRCRCRRPWPPYQRVLGEVLRVGGDGDRGFLRQCIILMSERRFRLLLRTRHGHLQEQKTLGSRLGSLY